MMRESREARDIHHAEAAEWLVSCESEQGEELSLSLKSAIRGTEGGKSDVSRVHTAEFVDRGKDGLGLRMACASNLCSAGDIREWSSACTRAWRAWAEQGV